MTALRLMVQGTGSSVGKSLLVTALCRIFRRRGFAVAPFKSQNMSLNSFITKDGHEMGRAQAVQAEAARLAPDVLMNPVLLKPTGDRTSQLIVNGVTHATLTAQEYHTFRASLKPTVLKAFKSLATRYELVLIEGAGSPAEINLRENDIANMGMAALADAPVLLVGDIDRGGVFASLYGTVKLLEKEEQRRICAVVINKFRGDRDILEPGIRKIESLLNLPVLGVLPYWNVHIDEEDSLTERLRQPSPALTDTNVPELKVAVIRLPRLANFTDFAVFDNLAGTRLFYAQRPSDLKKTDLVILPGSKNTLRDLRYLKESGFAARILALHKEGVPIIGICGGYQMLGMVIRDPLGVESKEREAIGLRLLNMETLFAPHKCTTQMSLHITHEAANTGILQGTKNMLLHGYEIHMGQSSRSQGNTDAPLGITAEGRIEGAVNRQGTVFGSYVHGLFDNLCFTRALLDNLRKRKNLPPLLHREEHYADFREAEYERLADLTEANFDVNALLALMQKWENTRSAGCPFP